MGVGVSLRSGLNLKPQPQRSPAPSAQHPAPSAQRLTQWEKPVRGLRARVGGGNDPNGNGTTQPRRWDVTIVEWTTVRLNSQPDAD